MNTKRADAPHEPPPQARGNLHPAAPAPGARLSGPEDRIKRAVGTDRDVLLVGTDSPRYGGGLARQRCRLSAVGCDAGQVAGFGGPAVAGDLDDLDLVGNLGDRRFDAILATEMLDCSGDPAALIDRFRGWLRPGGFVVTTQSESPHRSPDPAAASGTLISLFEGAGYAITGYQPSDLAPGEAPAEARPARLGWSLVVAVPAGDLDGDGRNSSQRALAADRDAAARHAVDLARELASAGAEVAALRGDLGRSRRREAELAGLLRQAHERAERDNEELRSLAQRFADETLSLTLRSQDDVHREAVARQAVEDRLNQFRRSLPGRIFQAIRSFTSPERA